MMIAPRTFGPAGEARATVYGAQSRAHYERAFAPFID